METYIKIKAFRDSYDVRDVETYTIEQLIEELSNYPKSAKVVLSFNGYSFGGITDNEICYTEVETKEEQEERERREQEEEDNTTLVCPHCESENICTSVKGNWICLDCGERFAKARIITNEN